MNKKFFGLMAVLAAVMAAVGCSANGTPASLVGEWKCTTEDSMGGITVTSTTYIKIDSDDNIWGASESSGGVYTQPKGEYAKQAKIVNCTCSSGTYKYYISDDELGDKEQEFEFEVTCNSLAWTMVYNDGKSKQTRIYEKVQ